MLINFQIHPILSDQSKVNFDEFPGLKAVVVRNIITTLLKCRMLLHLKLMRFVYQSQKSKITKKYKNFGRLQIILSTATKQINLPPARQTSQEQMPTTLCYECISEFFRRLQNKLILMLCLLPKKLPFNIAYYDMNNLLGLRSGLRNFNVVVPYRRRRLLLLLQKIISMPAYQKKIIRYPQHQCNCFNIFWYQGYCLV